MRFRSHARRESGSIALAIIVLLLLIGGAVFLVQYRKQTEDEGRQFAREVIKRVASDHDAKFLHSVVAPAYRLEFTQGMEAEFIRQFQQLGKPEPSFVVTGDLQFDDYIAAPRGSFQSILTFPDRHATITVGIGRPAGIWQLNALSITWERPPQ